MFGAIGDKPVVIISASKAIDQQPEVYKAIVVLVDGKDDTFFYGSLKDALDLSIESKWHDTKLKYDMRITDPQRKCEVTVSIHDILSTKGNIYIDDACHLLCEEYDLNTRYLWQKHPPKYKQLDIVGVHVRQGSLVDFEYENFFGEWHTPESRSGGRPYFCCFEDQARNNSSCPDNIELLESFERAMRRYGPNQKFCVVSDRPGCSIELHRRFPGQVLDMTVHIGCTTDMATTVRDWINLSRCKEIIVSKVSSFSYEATRVHGARLVSLS